MIGRSALLAIATLLGGCGGSPPPASARPVRIADHETEEAPAPEVVAVTAASDDGPRAEPPPVEPPAVEEEE